MGSAARASASSGRDPCAFTHRYQHESHSGLLLRELGSTNQLEGITAALGPPVQGALGCAACRRAAQQLHQPLRLGPAAIRVDAGHDAGEQAEGEQ